MKTDKSEENSKKEYEEDGLASYEGNLGPWEYGNASQCLYPKDIKYIFIPVSGPYSPFTCISQGVNSGLSGQEIRPSSVSYISNVKSQL